MDIVLIDCSVAVKTNFIIFPVDIIELMNLLGESGYVIPQKPQTPVGAKLEMSGIVAKWGNVSIDFDSGKQLLGCRGNSISEVLNSFMDIHNKVAKEFSLDLKAMAHYYESISIYRAKTGHNPIETINKTGRNDIYEEVGSILKMRVSPYSLHLCTPEKSVNSLNWLDMSIKPLSYKSDSTYEIVTVIRNKEASPVMEFVSRLEFYISEILSRLERRDKGKSRLKPISS